MFFSSDTGHGEDGYLYAYELSNMQLKTNLVTLITCFSGSGSISKGEGVLSIGRSFVNAGSPSMVMSLWSASAEPAFEIMKEFYWELIKGNGKTQALRIAKIKYLEKASPMTANPMNWSGLVLIGNPDAIFHLYFLKMVVLPFFIIILLILFIVFRRRLINLF
jgi:CHAT domain-containing protein